MSGWISVNDSLPKNQSLKDECNEYVLVAPIDHDAVKAMYCDGEWYISYIAKLIIPVTHWMPLNIPEKIK